MTKYLRTSESCNKRFHPKSLGSDRSRVPYWFFCRLAPGHRGDCDCPAAHEEKP